MADVMIVGAGISGLATALLLKKQQPDWQLSILEKECLVGGKMRSETQGDFVFDWGSNGFLANAPETLELIRTLGIEEKLVNAADSAKHRFLFHKGRLTALPLSPRAFLKSDLLSTKAKMRALLEPWLAGCAASDESVYDFMKRHFGREMADTFASPMVLGITAGDAKTLSFSALFPRLSNAVEEHGSVLKALRTLSSARKTPTQKNLLSSFKPGGIGTFIEALKAMLESELKTNEDVQSLMPEGSGFKILLASGEVLQAGTVILAVPAYEASRLLQSFLPECSLLLNQISYASATVVGLGYKRSDVLHDLNGFGFLKGQDTSLRALGVLWSTSIFPHQAAPDTVMLRAICGGSLDPTFVNLSEADAIAAVRTDFELSMGITAEPIFKRLVRWKKAIPQYKLGHARRVTDIMAQLKPFPNLILTGNAYHGIGVNDCVRQAHRVVAELQTKRS